jgi:hypothetical protein
MNDLVQTETQRIVEAHSIVQWVSLLRDYEKN